ncbi:hypothetical protein [Polycladomyces subterraneus]|uniref:Uncharacterized protein n=1 Tax=Polycladomyces subterraneus TaxID=1016997 RepID=A0ABT8IJY7_9BACL|nr:hypothetical protein [Polycladomyces subterraneus]MDN4593077.1 hypothetical protein [Polycladomyces subterraneus]
MDTQRETRPQELGDILPFIDKSVRELYRFEPGQDPAPIRLLLGRVQQVQETLHRRNLTKRYPQLHEVVCFLYLCCFSVVHLGGESFHTYREEVKLRYKGLLRSLYFFFRRPRVTKKCMNQY